MRKHHTFAAWMLMIFTIISGSVCATEIQTTNAIELVTGGQRAVGLLVVTGRDDPALRVDNAKSKPFWEAVQQLSESFGDVARNLANKNDDMFTALATVVASAQQAEIALIMIGDVSKDVGNRMSTVSSIARALDQNYSKEAARLLDKRELTAEEREQLEKLKAQQNELDKKLKAVEEHVGKNDDNIRRGIDDIRANSRRIRDANYTYVDFCNAMFAARFMAGALWGWHWWWGPWGYWGPGYINISINVWDVWIDDYAYDWALADAAVEYGAMDLEADILKDIVIEEAALDDAETWLEETEFAIDEAELTELSSDIETGWDQVETDIGHEVLDGIESNFDATPFDSDGGFDTFDDFGGFDDFGSDFGGFDY